jgi:hypothetical protein
MEEQFQLHEYGKLSIFEQSEMTAEERAWWMKRIQREIEERNERERDAASGSRSSVPSVSMPSISIPSVSMPRR